MQNRTFGFLKALPPMPEKGYSLPPATMVIVEGQTTTKRMSKGFAEKKDTLNSVFSALPFGILVIDRDARLEMCNPTALNLLGISKKAGELIGTEVFDHLGELPEVVEALEKSLSHGRRSFELKAVFSQEKILSVQVRSMEEGLVVIIDDMTEVQEEERANLGAVLRGQEAERRRLAKEIHDGIGPVMSTVKLHLDAVKSTLNDLPPNVIRKIDTMGELIQQAASDIRSISHALMPSALIDLGLVPALDNLCRQADESDKIQVKFYESGMKERLSKKMALGLYRIAQELLNNSFKYSQAKLISLQLIRHPESLLLMVEDDGIGFDTVKVNEYINEGRGIGLRNVETRVRYLGGSFTLDAWPGQGVSATVEIPIENAMP